MTPELLSELSCYPAFPKNAVDLIRIAGMDGAAALISAWPGQEWPCPIRIGGGNDKGVRRYEQLVEVVGDSTARRIVQCFGGGMLIVPNMKVVMRQRAQALIRSEYDELIRTGYSSPEAVFSLGIKFNLNGRAVERIIRRPDMELSQPIGQGCLFGSHP